MHQYFNIYMYSCSFLLGIVVGNNVSPQKLSTKTKDRLKKAIKKSDLYESAYFFYENYSDDEGARTLKKELKGLFTAIIEIMETD